MRGRVIAVLGPTASGKTALAAALAREYGGEVISADSMQIYRGMDIATAKPTAEETLGVPHHLISIAERTQLFSVAEYLRLARTVFADITARGKIAVLCGGTGLYASAFLDNIQFDDTEPNIEIRRRLLREAEDRGGAEMLARLREIDPETAGTLHENNLGRIIRALEVYETSGISLSEQKRRSRLSPPDFDSLRLGLLYQDREVLYARINRRVDLMLEKGLLAEARAAYEARGETPTSGQAIGCKELFPYFDGTATLAQCVETVKRETRRYAKRQMTWLRRDPLIHWVPCGEFSDAKKILQESKKIIAKEDFL